MPRAISVKFVVVFRKTMSYWIFLMPLSVLEGTFLWYQPLWNRTWYRYLVHVNRNALVIGKNCQICSDLLIILLITCCRTLFFLLRSMKSLCGPHPRAPRASKQTGFLVSDIDLHSTGVVKNPDTRGNRTNQHFLLQLYCAWTFIALYFTLEISHS